MLGRIKRIARPEARNRDQRPRLEALERRDLLTGFTVTNPNDSGTGSLRVAIQAADADGTPGADSISFAIGTGSQTISVLSALPAITRAVVIDGATQPQTTGGGTVTTGPPRIILDGSKAGVGADGLTFTGGSGNLVRDLAIVNFAATTTGTGGRGILVNDGGGDTFVADYLGVDPNGTTAKPNVVGIEIQSANNVIGALMSGASTSSPNLISGNLADGVLIDGAKATGNQVVGNLIGTDITGQFSVGNLHGVTISGASNNLVGGGSSATTNLISGNLGPGGGTGIGVYLTGSSTGNVVAGNRIGTNAQGTRADSNAYGIYFGTLGAASSSEVISNVGVGGAVPGTGNLISGNGIGIAGNLSASTIAGNLIGTDATGTLGIGNSYGIYLGATGTTIGGTTGSARNVIVSSGKIGSGGVGLTLTGDADTVAGNLIGLNATQTAILPNAVGISLHTTNTTIGGTTQAAANIISGNTGDGIDLDSSAGNRLYGNLIGSVAGGALGNGGDGINVVLAAPTATTGTGSLALADTIGGITAGLPNLIAGNAGAGIAVTNNYGAYTGLAIRGNQILGNGKLGINLGPTFGVPVSGTLAIFPAATSATASTPTGVLGGTPGEVYQVDFYGNAAADPSGYGQGQTYLGSAAVTIGAGGLTTFAVPTSALAFETATATDPNGSTSEFSAAYPNSLPAADLAITQAVSAATVTNGGLVTFTATVTNTSTTNTAQRVVFNDALTTSLVNARITSSVGTASVATGNLARAQLGSLAPGASASITITANTSVNGTINNTAGVIGSTPEVNYSNNQATTSFDVGSTSRPTADLAITVNPASTAPTVGTNLTYLVTVTNNGPTDATNVTANDFLPSGATLVSASPSQGAAATVVGTLVSDNLGTITAGGSATLTVIVTPGTAGSITNSVNVSGGQLDTVTSNNSASSTLTVGTTGTAALTLTQTLTPTVGVPGQPELFTLTVRNTGTGAATGVILVDSLPAGVTFTAATPTQGSPATISNRVVTSDLGTIAAGGSATLSVAVVPTGTTSQVNFAGVVATGSSATTPVFSTAVLNVANGPAVTRVVGSRSNAQLVVNFSEPITAASATTRANYRLYALGSTPRALTASDLPIAFTTAVYNATTNSVTLTPSRSINATRYYALVIVGNTAAGITDTSGRKLVGAASGTAGTNSTTTFLAGTLPQA